MIKGLPSLILRGPLRRELEAVPLPLLSAGTATSTATGEANVSSDFTLEELTFALRATGTVPLGDNGSLSLDAGAASLDVGTTPLLSTGAVLLLTAAWASASSEESSLSLGTSSVWRVEIYPRSFFLNGFGLL